MAIERFAARMFGELRDAPARDAKRVAFVLALEARQAMRAQWQAKMDKASEMVIDDGEDEAPASFPFPRNDPSILKEDLSPYLAELRENSAAQNASSKKQKQKKKQKKK
eukprot:TRINITY_DN28014_c0_g1_i1.p1 TRINITY_DN28014_c0_g1~~TRINITY_DN28014_c0_g1_i1.p1  ORF type:complete len:109 (+),score=7.83 TRINITY_DN28014_c0_g1_i1:3-329(+)